MDVVPRLRGAGRGGDAAVGGVGVRVVEHLACPLSGADSQHSGAGADIAHRRPGTDRRGPTTTG